MSKLLLHVVKVGVDGLTGLAEAIRAIGCIAFGRAGLALVTKHAHNLPLWDVTGRAARSPRKQ